MISAVIIDDEIRSINVLQKLLKMQPQEVDILNTAQSVEDGIKVINQHKPDLVFLDINMPGGDGFELLDRIEKVDFEIIFVTAHSDYVLAAMRCGAIDYLHKPVDLDELKNALERISEKKAKNNSPTDYQKMMNLLMGQFNKNKIIPVATQTVRIY